jgi:hypothetical protein
MQYSFAIGGEVKVEQADGTNRFAIHNLLPGNLAISAADRSIEVDVQNPSTELSINLDQPTPKPQMRHVVLRFVGPDAGLYPAGQVRISSIREGTDSPNNTVWKVVPIQNGVVELDAFVPGFVTCTAENVVGYWFKDVLERVTPGEGTWEKEIPVVAAGAIRGVVLNADGSPAAQSVRVGARSKEVPSTVDLDSVNVNNIEVDGQGSFFISPIPLGGEYLVRAGRGFELAISESVRVDAEQTSPTMSLRFGPTGSATGRVLRANGTPAANVPVALEFRHPEAGTGFSPALLTDTEGQFRFDGLSMDIGEYWVTVGLRIQQKVVEERLNLDGEPIQIRLGH